MCIESGDVYNGYLNVITGISFPLVHIVPQQGIDTVPDIDLYNDSICNTELVCISTCTCTCLIADRLWVWSEATL